MKFLLLPICLLLAAAMTLCPLSTSVVPRASAASRPVWGLIPTNPQRSIVLTDFEAASPELKGLALELSASLRSVLQNSGLNVANKPIRGNERPKIGVQPDFLVWRSKAVEILVLGRIHLGQDGRLRTEVRVWDITMTDQLIGRAYVALPADWMRLRDSIAGDIYERIQ